MGVGLAESSSHEDKRSLRGAFITFEGIDGCGKTTQAKLLAERLRAVGHSVVETREPGGTSVGMGLREVLLDPANKALTPECELLLFLADRVQHLGELIVPALERGDTVICDRFHDSTVAFQRYGRGLDFSAVDSVVRTSIEPSTPHLTCWLDAEPDLAWERIRQRLREAGTDNGDSQATGTRLENEAKNFHLRVRDGYEKLYEAFPQRIVRVDAAREIDEIAGEIWKIVSDRFDVL